MKKNILSIVLIALVLVTAVTGCNKKEVLTLFTWPEMFPQELLDRFTEETGIEINYVNFDFDETMLAKLQASGGADYDFVIADDYIIEQAIAEGLVAELDRTKISTWNNINPIFQGQFYDPEDKYTVPCGSGIMELVYRPSATGFEINSFRDLWDERLKDRVGIIANPRVINGLVLKMNNSSFNTTDVNAIKAISEDYKDLVPNIRLVKDDFLNDDLVSKEIDAGLLYSSQAVVAVLTDPELKAVIPEEGTGFGVMGGFIPSKAPNSKAAYKFIEFLNEADNAAEWFNFMGYYCTNKAADTLLDPSIKNLVTIPESLDVTKLEMIENIPGEIYEVHEQVWTDFLNQCN